MADPRIAATFVLDPEPLNQAVKKITDTFHHSATEWNSKLELVKKGFELIVKPAEKLIDIIGEATKAAMTHEAEERKFVAMMQSRAKVTDENIEKIKEFNEGLREKFGYEEADTMHLQAKLLALGVMPAQLEKATKATLGYAEATGKDLSRAAKSVAEHIRGGTGEGLVAMFGAVEAQAGTLATRIKILSAEKEELAKTLGKTVEKSDAAKLGITLLSQAVKDFTTFLASSAGIAMVDGLFRKLAGIVEVLAKIPVGVMNKLFGSQEEWAAARNRDAAASGGSVYEGPREPNFLERLSARAGAIANGEKTGSSEGNIVPGVITDAEEAERRKQEAMAAAKKRAEEMKKYTEKLREDEITAKAKWRAEDVKLEQQTNEAIFDEKVKAYAIEKEFEQAKRDEQFNKDVAAFDRRQRAIEQFNEISRTSLILGFGSFVSSMAESAVEGNLTVGKFFGGLVKMLGQTLIQLGTAALTVAMLGAVIPMFAFLTGGPVGIAAALATVAAGGAIVGAGTLMEAGGSASSASASSHAFGGSGSSGSTHAASSPEMKGYSGGSGAGAPVTNVYNVSFGQGVITGTPRQVARAIRDTLSEGNLALGGAR